MSPDFQINGRSIAPGESTYIIAELSANHNQDFAQAVKLVEAAHEAGADAIKLQTYTPDTITIDCRNDYFQIKGTLWDGRNLYDLYGEAHTPWDWQPKLKTIANELGMDLFSTPFDRSAIDFLETMGVPAYKVASFELIDLTLIEQIAWTGKPIIMSTGMATLNEIDEAVRAARAAGNPQIALLKCNSAYPAPPDEMNLRTIPNMAEAFGVPVGLSDHTLGIEVPVASVALGACIIEKHFTLSRATPGPDSAFSLEPHEFKAMVDAVRNVERALGSAHYGPTLHELKSMAYRRSLFAVQDIKAGDLLTEQNVRSIRPSDGLPPKYLPAVLGRRAARDIERGTPITWDSLLGEQA
jgi:pseudaminic acid synthase